ncbi:MAG: hypothetical protein ACKOXR_01580 [Bacteroidota bacterium]
MAFKFEQKTENLATVREFTKRMVWFGVFGLLFIVVSLSIGAIGYRYYADLNWIDSYYNASMILTGMGPVAVLTTDNAKIFATAYSIYSGVAFLTAVGVMFAPLVHRLFHRLHIDLE